MKLTPAAATRTRTSSAAGSGSGRSTSWRTSGPPGAVAWIARTVAERGGIRSSFPEWLSYLRTCRCMFMHMTFTVAVAGASGYAGGEMLRVLLAHPEARIGTLTAHSNAGTLLGAHQPHLRSLADRVLEPTGVDALQGHDVVVLALPHGASGAVAAELAARGDTAIVVDLGADHRLVDAADWEAYYGSAHAGTWPYGLPELLQAGERTASAQRATLKAATRIAVPGCNVTAVSLGLQPGIAAGLIEPTDIVAVLANGYSGAGKSLKTHLL